MLLVCPPEEAFLAISMGHDDRLGSSDRCHVHELQLDVLAAIKTMYDSWFWARPWDSREQSQAEKMFMVDQTSVVEIAYSLSRRVEDVRFALGIHDDESQMGDDMIRELESSILKGGIICDPENWGDMVWSSPVAIMPGQFGFTGGRKICEFSLLPTRLKAMMIRRRVVHDPDNVLGWGSVTFNPNM